MIRFTLNKTKCFRSNVSKQRLIKFKNNKRSTLCLCFEITINLIQGSGRIADILADVTVNCMEVGQR